MLKGNSGRQQQAQLVAAPLPPLLSSPSGLGCSTSQGDQYARSELAGGNRPHEVVISPLSECPRNLLRTIGRTDQNDKSVAQARVPPHASNNLIAVGAPQVG